MDIVDKYYKLETLELMAYAHQMLICSEQYTDEKADVIKTFSDYVLNNRREYVCSYMSEINEQPGRFLINKIVKNSKKFISIEELKDVNTDITSPLWFIDDELNRLYTLVIDRKGDNQTFIDIMSIRTNNKAVFRISETTNDKICYDYYIL